MNRDQARSAKSIGFLSKLICLAMVVPAWSAAPALSKLEKTEIAPDAGHGIGAISPDGSRVAILKTTGIGGIRGEGTIKNELEIHSVAPSSILASIPMPVIEGHRFRDPNLVSTFLFPKSSVRYCDHGKYILAYGDMGTFFVIDTADDKLKSTITFGQEGYPPGSKTPYGHIMISLADACSANGNVAAFELLYGPYSTGTTAIFDLDTGRQLGSIAEDISPGRLRGIDVSPSGASAAIVLERVEGDQPPAHKQDLVILDLISHTVSRRILTGIDLLDTAFVGESSVAVASGDGVIPKRKPAIALFDIHSGAQTRRFGEQGNGADGVVSASADGRFLVAYSGKDNYCEHCLIAEHRGYLRIEDARFTVWDVSTGKVVAHSPKIRMDKGGILSFTIYQRPVIEISQSGNAVLVSQPGGSEPTDVYSLK